MVVGCGNSRQDRGEVVSVVVVGCGNSRQDRGVVVVGRAGVWWYHLCGEVWNSRAVLVHFTILILISCS